MIPHNSVNIDNDDVVEGGGCLFKSSGLQDTECVHIL